MMGTRHISGSAAIRLENLPSWPRIDQCCRHDVETLARFHLLTAMARHASPVPLHAWKLREPVILVRRR